VIIKQPFHVHAVDEGHRHVIDATGCAKLVNADDIWMAELGDGLCLSLKAPGIFWIVRHARVDDLDRGHPIQIRIDGPVHARHSAVAEQFVYHVVAKLLPDERVWSKCSHDVSPLGLLSLLPGTGFRTARRRSGSVQPRFSSTVP